MPFYLKEDADSCQWSHLHGEWCLKVIVSCSGPNLCVSHKSLVAELFETPFRTQEIAEFMARTINRDRFGRSLCLACESRLTSNGGCPDPQCSFIHDAVGIVAAGE